MVIDTQRRRGVALGIEVHHQNARTVQGERGSEVDRGGGLPYAALLVGDNHDACLFRSGQPLTGTPQRLHSQLSSTADGGVVHGRRCFT
jgi:hypothetical protein